MLFAKKHADHGPAAMASVLAHGVRQQSLATLPCALRYCMACCADHTPPVSDFSGCQQSCWRLYTSHACNTARSLLHSSLPDWPDSTAQWHSYRCHVTWSVSMHISGTLECYSKPTTLLCSGKISLCSCCQRRCKPELHSLRLALVRIMPAAHSM